MALVVGVAVLRNGRVLAARRSDVGGWEFPGGKVEPAEDPAAAAVREIAEELGCGIEVTGWLTPTVPIREGLELRIATARLETGEPIPAYGDHDAIRWVPPAGLASLTWLEPDLPFVAELAAGGVAAPD
jgi:8-oxo-dGTP diphosphatase